MKKNIMIDKDSFVEANVKKVGVIADISISDELIEATNQAIEYCKSNNLDLDTAMEIIRYVVDTSTFNIIVSAGMKE